MVGGAVAPAVYTVKTLKSASVRTLAYFAAVITFATVFSTASAAVLAFAKVLNSVRLPWMRTVKVVIDLVPCVCVRLNFYNHPTPCVASRQPLICMPLQIVPLLLAVIGI